MTSDEIAIANLAVAKLQLWITALAIFLGPLAGVIFTFWFQSRKDKSAEKHKLFITLMGERKSLPFSRETVKALNTIDIVFSNNPIVIGLWHKYYALLSQPTAGEERGHTWIELLTAMAADLRYPNVKQTDLDKFYIPQGHVDDAEFQRKVALQWSRVLENTERFLVEKKTEG
jgi:hypothetical protein